MRGHPDVDKLYCAYTFNSEGFVSWTGEPIRPQGYTWRDNALPKYHSDSPSAVADRLRDTVGPFTAEHSRYPASRAIKSCGSPYEMSGSMQALGMKKVYGAFAQGYPAPPLPPTTSQPVGHSLASLQMAKSWTPERMRLVLQHQAAADRQ